MLNSLLTGSVARHGTSRISWRWLSLLIVAVLVVFGPLAAVSHAEKAEEKKGSEERFSRCQEEAIKSSILGVGPTGGGDTNVPTSLVPSLAVLFSTVPASQTLFPVYRAPHVDPRSVWGSDLSPPAYSTVA